MIMSYLMPACERMSHFWNIQTLKSYEVNILELDGLKKKRHQKAIWNAGIESLGSRLKQ